MQRGRAARAKAKQLREEGASKEDVAKAQKEEEEAMAMFKGTAEEQAAATKLQALQRGKMARKRVAQIKDGGDGDGGDQAGSGGDGAGPSGAGAEVAAALPEPTQEEKEEAEAEILLAEIFGRLVAMLQEQDSEVQRVGALALSVYTGDSSPDAHGSAEAAVSAGALAPLVAVFSSDSVRAVTEAAGALETISIELPEEQDRAQRAGALDACLRLVGTDQEPTLRVAGAKALRGLLLQNQANCREVMDKGGLDLLLNLQEQPEPGCQSAASLALSSLADADTEILQALGVETLVGMAVRAKDPATR